MSLSLDIIIVNWNSGAHLLRCLGSMLLASREGFELARVVVVDNASSDGSAGGVDFLDLPADLAFATGFLVFAADFLFVLAIN